MLDTRQLGLIEGISNHCRRIEKKTKNISIEEFIKDQDIIDIISFNLLQLGELAKKLDASIENVYDIIPWRLIKGMRDHIAHGYETLDLTLVYETAKKDITTKNDIWVIFSF